MSDTSQQQHRPIINVSSTPRTVPSPAAEPGARVEPSDPPTETVRSARRRLVRGAFAAPAVLALYSGSAVAMASSLRCVNNQVRNSPVRHVELSDGRDRYVRVQLWSLKPLRSTVTPDKYRWYLSGDDFVDLATLSPRISNSFLVRNQWRRFDSTATAPDLVVGNPLLSRPVWSSEDNGVLTRDGQWVAVRIFADRQGVDILGVIDGSLDGSAVSGLCWASFVTGA